MPENNVMEAMETVVNEVTAPMTAIPTVTKKNGWLIAGVAGGSAAAGIALTLLVPWLWKKHKAKKYSHCEVADKAAAKKDDDFIEVPQEDQDED